MGWTCTLFIFSKKINSTAQPSGGTSFDCLIKHDTDFINPTLEIHANDLSVYNYMLFNGSYYYITSLISHRNDIWEVTGMRDPLATFKYDILNTQSLVMFGQHSYNGMTSAFMPDERIPVIRQPSYYSNYAAFGGNLFSFSLSGSYLLSVVGENNCVDTYIVPVAQMNRLLNSLAATLGQRIWNAIPDSPLIMDEPHMLYYLLCAGHEVWKSEAAFGNYAELIRSCIWVPFSFDTSQAGSKQIYIGDYDTGSIGYYFSNNILTGNTSISIPWPVTDGRRNGCMVQVNLPLAGKVPLPTDKIINASAVDIYTAIDTIQGTVSYEITAGGYTHMVTGANAGTPYAIGSNNVSLASMVSGISGVVGGGIMAGTGAAAASPLAVVGGIASVGQGIAEIITPQTQATGAMAGASGAGLRSTIEVELLYYRPLAMSAFEGEYGHPVGQLSTPEAGYNQCKGFSVNCSGTPAEKETINAYFNSGAYIE